MGTTDVVVTLLSKTIMKEYGEKMKTFVFMLWLKNKKKEDYNTNVKKDVVSNIIVINSNYGTYRINTNIISSILTHSKIRYVPWNNDNDLLSSPHRNDKGLFKGPHRNDKGPLSNNPVLKFD
jgi:hypothetical protein